MKPLALRYKKAHVINQKSYIYENLLCLLDVLYQILI
jgi:hypothetical protein